METLLAYFPPNILSSSALLKLAEQAAESFAPTRIGTRKGIRAFRKRAQLREALDDPAFSRLSLQGKATEEHPRFSVNSLPPDIQLLTWTYPRGASFDHLAMEALNLPGFNVMHCYESDDVVWQNETHIENYKFFERPYSHLPTYVDPEMNEVLIDISQNPGREDSFPGMSLLAAQRMWYGRGAFPFLPRERLLNFPDAHRIEELDNDIVFIELYEDPLDYENPENRRRQKAFRDWMGFDELAAKASALLDELPSDPAVEIDEGEFPHGGVRRLREWFDAENLPCNRSKARYCIEVEYDAEGNDLWQGKIPLEDAVD